MSNNKRKKHHRDSYADEQRQVGY